MIQAQIVVSVTAQNKTERATFQAWFIRIVAPYQNRCRAVRARIFLATGAGPGAKSEILLQKIPDCREANLHALRCRAGQAIS